jgi:hypothetical protein
MQLIWALCNHGSGVETQDENDHLRRPVVAHDVENVRM